MLTRRTMETTPLTQLRAEMDRLMSDFLGDYEPFGNRAHFGTRTVPVLNVWEDENNVYAEAELPGVSEDNIDISVTGRELTVKGERPKPQVAESAAALREERGYGAFSRVINLPFDIDAEQVKAELNHGVLTVPMPKAAESRTRRVNVQSK